MKLHLAKVLALAGLLLAGVGASVALATPANNGNGPPATVPGSPGDDCSHGNSDKDCKPDPSENGKDCDDHGKARGNEDHCDATTTTTTTTPTTSTTTTTTTTTTTSTTTTTPTTTTIPKTTTTTPTTPTTTTNPSPPGTTTSTPTNPSGPSTPPAAPTGETAGTATNPPTKPELQKELAKQAKGVRGSSNVRSNPNELPFTGFPAWLLAAIGSAMLAAGLILRKVSAQPSNANDAKLG